MMMYIKCQEQSRHSLSHDTKKHSADAVAECFYRIYRLLSGYGLFSDCCSCRNILFSLHFYKHALLPDKIFF